MSNQQKANRNSEVGDRNALPIKVKLFDAKPFQAKWEFLLYLCEIKSARTEGGDTANGLCGRRFEKCMSRREARRTLTGANSASQRERQRYSSIFNGHLATAAVRF